MAISRKQKKEIADSRVVAKTVRPTVPALEKVLGQPFEALDHGFVRAIDYMGDDAAIVQAARVSYGAGTKKISEDAGLIRYLMRHRHTTPFEMCDIKFHVKMPIFVARQWIRHRTASVNEYSARYSIVQDEFYLPEPQVLASQSKSNRQGRDETLSKKQADKILSLLPRDSKRAYDHYRYMLNDTGDGTPENPKRDMLARELARMGLSLNYYTEWYWKINLHNLFHFLSLRADPHAQYEIRVYAEQMLKLTKLWVPIAHEAFVEYQLFGARLSKTGIEIVKKMLQGEKVTQETSGLSKREWSELMNTLGKT